MNTKVLIMDMDFILDTHRYGDLVFDQQFQTGAGLNIRQTMWCIDNEQYLEIRVDGNTRAFFKID